MNRVPAWAKELHPGDQVWYPIKKGTDYSLGQFEGFDQKEGVTKISADGKPVTLDFAKTLHLSNGSVAADMTALNNINEPALLLCREPVRGGSVLLRLGLHRHRSDKLLPRRSSNESGFLKSNFFHT